MLDRLLILKTMPYEVAEIAKILKIRADTEGIKIDEASLEMLAQIGEELFQGGNAGLDLIHLLVDAIHLISGFEDFAALHFRVFGGGRVRGLSDERSA